VPEAEPLRDNERCASLPTCQEFRPPVQRKNLPSFQLGKSTQVSWQLICPPLHDYIHAFYCIIHHYFSSMHVDVILFLALYNTTLMWYQTAAQICSLLYRATLTCFGAIFRWQHHQKAPPTRCTAHTCASFCVCIVAHSFP
jgi:hypothetical protein